MTSILYGEAPIHDNSNRCHVNNFGKALNQVRVRQDAQELPLGAEFNTRCTNMSGQ